MKNIKLTNYCKLGFLAALVLNISACASVKNPDAPVPQNYTYSYQKQLQASQHWAIVADDMSNQVIRNLQSRGIFNKPVYVAIKSNHSAFSQALNDFMITNLVKKGAKVSRSKEKSTVLDYKVQVLKFNANRSVALPPQAPLTVLAGGVVVTRVVADAIDLTGFEQAIITGAVLADLWTNDKAPKLELVVTASIVENNLYTMRTTDIYYANAEDINLYKHNKMEDSPFDDPFYNQRRR
jgi:hypothetical protein